MNQFRSVLALALGSLAATPATAQDDFQQWLQLGAKVDLADSISLHNEFIARSSDDRGGLYEIENTVLLGYKLSDKVVAWAGYVHNPQYVAGNFTLMERRAREQVTIDNFAKIGGASLSVCMRLEQRWREGATGTAWRARPYAKLAVPLGGKGAPVLNLTAEPFINFNNTAFQSVDGLERIRSAANLSFSLAKPLKLEAGYLNQHRFVRNGPDTDDHAVTVSLGLSF